MRKHSKVILAAEEQLVFGHSLSEMVAARDNLRSVVPESLLLELLGARIVRRRLTYRPVSPGQRKDKNTTEPALVGGLVTLGQFFL